MIVEVKEKPALTPDARRLIAHVEQAGMTPAQAIALIDNAAYFSANGHEPDEEPPYCDDAMYADEPQRHQSVRCPHCGRDVPL